MIVIKLGGSLSNDVAGLTACLNTIEQKLKGKVVIVPGGGVFADQVRVLQKQWQFDDLAAHNMALLAMQQMALLLSSIKPELLIVNKVSALNNHLRTIWSPDIQELKHTSIKANWDITSDSLAAWLATQLKAVELILVKSAKIPQTSTVQQMQKQGLVDNAFAEYTKNATYKITVINKNKFNERAFTESIN